MPHGGPSGAYGGDEGLRRQRASPEKAREGGDWIAARLVGKGHTYRSDAAAVAESGEAGVARGGETDRRWEMETLVG